MQVSHDFSGGQVDPNFDPNAGEQTRILANEGEQMERGNPEFQGSRALAVGLLWWRWGRVELPVQTSD